MRTADNTTITVGVDGSNASARALVWAIHEAVEGGMEVEVLTAWPEQDAVMVHEVPGHFSDSRGRAVAAQRRIVAQARSEVVRLPRIIERIENRRPFEALLEASTSSHLLVVGSGRARKPRFGVESTRLVDRCFDEAPCAVAVVGEDGSVHRRQRRFVGRATH